jgi:hypothetical protein
VFEASAGVHSVQVRAGKILSPEAQVEVTTGGTVSLACWTSPATLDGPPTHANWFDLHISTTEASAPFVPPAIARTSKVKFVAATIAVFVLAGVITGLLVVGDHRVALAFAIPLIAFVIWLAFRPKLSRDRR